MVDLDNHFYIISLSDDFDYERAVFYGPWIISDHYLTVQKWYPDFDSKTALILKIVAWIRVPDLTFEFFTKSILAKIGICFGRVLRIDEATSKRNHAQFVRIGVEIDLGKPLQSKFVFRNQIHNIQYESLHAICFGCEKYGHRHEAFPERIQPIDATEALTSQSPAFPPVSLDKLESFFDRGKDFGARMMAKWVQ